MFLKQVYAQSKLIFYLILIFCLGQLLFLYRGVENTPFFLYGMYSEKKQTEQQYNYNIIQIDGKEFDPEKLPFGSHEMVLSTLDRYCFLDKVNFNDTISSVVSKRFKSRISEGHFNVLVGRLTNGPADKICYQRWLKKYLAQATGGTIRSLKIYRGNFSYAPDFHLVSKELLFEINE